MNQVAAVASVVFLDGGERQFAATPCSRRQRPPGAKVKPMYWLSSSSR